MSDLAPASIRAAATESGEVDHVVCATGVDVRRALGAHTDEDVATQLDVALAGPIHVARAFLGVLRSGGTIAVFGGFADGTLVLPYHPSDARSAHRRQTLARGDSRFERTASRRTAGERKRPAAPRRCGRSFPTTSC